MWHSHRGFRVSTQVFDGILAGMTTPVLSRQQSREVDRIAIEQYGFSGLVLMENAARGVVDVLLEIDPHLVDSSQRSVTIFCGKGNNGGDGFAIARHLEIRGVRSQVVLLVSPDELTGDALANFKILRHTNVSLVDGFKSSSFSNDHVFADGSTWLVDAMLGTGAHGEPREPFAAAIHWMNKQSCHRLAVDVPSGLDCDSGKAAACTVRADHTCTFVASKRGFAESGASDFVGKLHIVSIGTPAAVLAEAIRG